MKLLKIFLIIVSFSLMMGCTGKKKDLLDEFYSCMEEEFSAAYKELGNPEVNRENMEEVKNLAWPRITKKIFGTKKEGTVSFSVSVLDDKLFLYVNYNKKEKKGHWKP